MSCLEYGSGVGVSMTCSLCEILPPVSMAAVSEQDITLPSKLETMNCILLSEQEHMNFM